MNQAPAYAADVLGSSETSSRRSELARLLLGAGLAFVFALAVGSAHPTLDLPARALLLPAASVASALFALPSLSVLLALFGVEVPLRALFAAAARGVATSGLVLAGLSPLVLLYSATSPHGLATSLVVFASLGLAFSLGIHATFADVLARLRASAPGALAPLGLVALSVVVSATVALRILGPSLSLLTACGGHDAL